MKFALTRTYDLPRQAPLLPALHLPFPFQALSKGECRETSTFQPLAALQPLESTLTLTNLTNRRARAVGGEAAALKRKRIRKQLAEAVAATSTNERFREQAQVIPSPVDAGHKSGTVSCFFAAREAMETEEASTAAAPSLSPSAERKAVDQVGRQERESVHVQTIAANSEKRFSDEFLDNLLANCDADRFLARTGRAHFCAHQTEVNDKMRAVLLNWLLSVHHKFRFRHQTFFTAVALLDLYCASRPVTRERYQLLGFASLFAAAKFEEIFPPKLATFLSVCDNFCGREQVLAAEAELLLAVDFKVPLHTTLQLVDLLTYRLGASPAVVEVAHSLAFAALFDLRSGEYGAERLARACIHLGLRVVSRQARERGEELSVQEKEFERQLNGKAGVGAGAGEFDPRVVKFMGFLVRSLDKAKLFAIRKPFPFFQNLAEGKEDQPKTIQP